MFSKNRDIEDNNVLKCLLLDGRIMVYDYAIGTKFQEKNHIRVDENLYEFLGEGFFWSRNGKVDGSEKKERTLFWRRIK